MEWRANYCESLWNTCIFIWVSIRIDLFTQNVHLNLQHELPTNLCRFLQWNNSVSNRLMKRMTEDLIINPVFFYIMIPLCLILVITLTSKTLLQWNIIVFIYRLALDSYFEDPALGPSTQIIWGKTIVLYALVYNVVLVYYYKEVSTLMSCLFFLEIPLR